MMQPSTIILLVTNELERLGIPYCIGGSIASSVYGEPRTTRDVDIVVNLGLSHVQRLVAAFEDQFYVFLPDIQEALAKAPTIRNDPAQRATFNMIHRQSFFKVDMFVSSGRPFELRQLDRAVRQVVVVDPEQSAILASPEDTILAKLEWYRLGSGLSDRQWLDIRSIIETQQSKLDVDYLREWAKHLLVADLLESALEGEAPSPPNTNHSSPDDPQQLRLF